MIYISTKLFLFFCNSFQSKLSEKFAEIQSHFLYQFHLFCFLIYQERLFQNEFAIIPSLLRYNLAITFLCLQH